MGLVMAMPVDPSLALGTLQTLADRQGTVVDPMTEEEPGKILHEVRLDVSSGPVPGRQVKLLRHVRTPPPVPDGPRRAVSRWGFAAETIKSPAAPRRPRTGLDRELRRQRRRRFVEYQRLNDHGLLNQGWKDSWDGINFADGTLAEPPDRAVRGTGLRLRRLPGAGMLAYDAAT